MRKSSAEFIRAVLAAASLLITLMVWAVPAQAAEFKMGVLDPMEVIEKSKAGKRELDKLKEYARTRQKVLSTDVEELESYKKQLQGSESNLTEAQKREKMEQFNVKVQAYQKRAQEFNQDLQVKNKEMIDEYMKKVSAATKAVAEKGGFNLVVDKGSEQTLRIVIYNKDTIDLTEQVVKEFDKVNK